MRCKIRPKVSLSTVFEIVVPGLTIPVLSSQFGLTTKHHLQWEWEQSNFSLEYPINFSKWSNWFHILLEEEVIAQGKLVYPSLTDQVSLRACGPNIEWELFENQAISSQQCCVGQVSSKTSERRLAYWNRCENFKNSNTLDVVVKNHLPTNYVACVLGMILAWLCFAQVHD